MLRSRFVSTFSTVIVVSVAGELAGCSAQTSPNPSSSTSTTAAPVVAPAAFPTFEKRDNRTVDFRGRPAPPFAAAQWVGPAPDVAGKVVVIEFWATWCGPCRASIPHINKMADLYREDAVFIGLSDETIAKLESFSQRTEMRFPVASDPSRSMQRSLGLTSVPYTLVMSADGVVRWQGHPLELDEQVLGAIVTANRTLVNRGA